MSKKCYFAAIGISFAQFIGPAITPAQLFPDFDIHETCPHFPEQRASHLQFLHVARSHLPSLHFDASQFAWPLQQFVILLPATLQHALSDMLISIFPFEAIASVPCALTVTKMNNVRMIKPDTARKIFFIQFLLLNTVKHK